MKKHQTHTILFIFLYYLTIYCTIIILNSHYENERSASAKQGRLRRPDGARRGMGQEGTFAISHLPLVFSLESAFFYD